MSSDIAILEKYFPNLNSLQKEQFTRLKPLYQEWNAQINVISRKDLDRLYERHILHSLSIAKFISFTKHSQTRPLGRCLKATANPTQTF